MANGIPDLLVNTSNIYNSVSMVVSDVQIFLNMFATSQWGIYEGNKKIIIPDSIVGFDFKKDFRISDYPQEKGGFQSYNKVELPYDCHVRMTKCGTESDRADFLNQVRSLATTLKLYNVLTPEIVYDNASITHYDYRRSSENGVGLLTVDLHLQEIRVTAMTTTITASPDGATSKSGGTVQPVTSFIPQGNIFQ